MSFSFTGLAYLIGFFALGLLAYRFFQYWQEEKTTISKLFFYFAGIFALFMLVSSITGLFFADNQTILKGEVTISAFLQGLACAVGGYIIVYLKFPKISPWFGFSVIFLLGLVATYLSIVTPYIPSSAPFLEPTRAINFGFQPPADILRFIFFFITFIPLIFIFYQQYRSSENPSVRTKAFGLGSVLLVGLIAAALDFFLESILKLGAISRDITLVFFNIILFIVIFLTQKPPSPKKEYIPPPPFSKIPW